MGQINRTGRVSFGDASLCVWEEGLGGSLQERDAWEKAFKRQVFKRIIQALNRLGWKCGIPEDKIKLYGQRFAEGRRYCVKGDLKADLEINGRCIQLEMFQNVTAPDRPDHEGRYQSAKEKHMPYVMRLEMERTRRKIRDYLCNVFSGYAFELNKQDSIHPTKEPLKRFNSMWGVDRFKRDESGWPAVSEFDYGHNKDREGVPLRNGMFRYWRDRRGYLKRGIIYTNMNSMWQLIYGPGRKDTTWVSSYELFTLQPDECLRRSIDPKRRESKLKSLLKEAVEAMNFERAATIRDLLLPRVVAP